jgi:hypothetical protein
MPESAAGSSVRRWWNRTTATILALGALATAIGAILALRPAPDPEDSARFTAIQVDSPVALSEAKARLRALIPPGGSGGRRDRPAPVRRLQPDPSANTQADPTTDTSAPDPTSSDTTASSSEPTSSTPETTGQPTSSSPGMAPSMEFDPPTGFGQEEFRAHVEQVMKRARERNPNNPTLNCKEEDPEDCRLERTIMRTIATGQSKAPDGTPVEPEVAAERLVKLLRNTRRTDGGGSRAREPLGVFVTVNLDLIGLRDREVLLSWSMVGGNEAERVHGDWLNDNLAYVLKATSDRDSTFQLIWIPLPRSSGPFRVQVHLKIDGAPLASQASDPFD